jgi:hypothetical protein
MLRKGTAHYPITPSCSPGWKNESFSSADGIAMDHLSHSFFLSHFKSLSTLFLRFILLYLLRSRKVSFYFLKPQ